MLGQDEKVALIDALELWASNVPDRPMLGFLGGNFLTPMEIVDAAIQETDDGRAILEMLEHGVRRQGLKAVTERLTRNFGNDGTESPRLLPLTN
jgi:hypothetical protein